MVNLPGARQERFTVEETDVLVRAVKDREVALYGDERNPSKLALVKRAWEEITTIVSKVGIPRTSHLCRKSYNDVRSRGKSKLAGNNRTRCITGGGSASTQDLTPAEDIAASPNPIHQLSNPKVHLQIKFTYIEISCENLFNHY